MFRILGVLALIVVPALAAPIPPVDGPTAEQQQIFEAIDEIQLSVSSFSAALLTVSPDGVADQKKFIEGQERRAKNLLALVRIVEKNNAQLKGHEKTATVLKSTLKNTAESLEKAATNLKAASGKDDWTDRLQKEGRQIVDAKLFHDLLRHRGVPLPGIIELRDE